MEAKKNVHPQQPNQNKKPENKSGDSGSKNMNSNKGNQQGNQVGQEDDVEEKSFQRTPGGQTNAQQGKRAIVNEDEDIVNDDEEMEDKSNYQTNKNK